MGLVEWMLLNQLPSAIESNVLCMKCQSDLDMAGRLFKQGLYPSPWILTVGSESNHQMIQGMTNYKLDKPWTMWPWSGTIWQLLGQPTWTMCGQPVLLIRRLWERYNLRVEGMSFMAYEASRWEFQGLAYVFMAYIAPRLGFRVQNTSSRLSKRIDEGLGFRVLLLSDNDVRLVEAPLLTLVVGPLGKKPKVKFNRGYHLPNFVTVAVE